MKNKAKITESTFLSYLAKANSGDADAQYQVGLCYENGNGVAKDMKKSWEYFTMAFQQGQPDALCVFANHAVCMNDYMTAFKYFKTAADQGLAYAQSNVGVYYMNGVGVERSINKGLEYFTLAANQGFALALTNLASFYLNGHHVEKDEKKAFIYYLLAAEQKCPVAQTQLGICYKNGMGVEKDSKKSAEYFRLAAEQKHALAQHLLGFCYMVGEGVEENVIKAFSLFFEAAKQRLPDACFMVGWFYNEGEYVTRNEKEAFNYFLPAAQQGYGKAEFQVAEYYRNGQVVERDLKKSFEFYMLADLHGVKNGREVVSTILCKLPEFKKIIDQYLILAQQKNADAQCYLGVCYQFGFVFPIDYENAAEYYRLSAAQGNKYASVRLSALLMDKSNPMNFSPSTSLLHHRFVRAQKPLLRSIANTEAEYLRLEAQITPLLSKLKQVLVSFPEDITEIVLDYTFEPEKTSSDEKKQP